MNRSYPRECNLDGVEAAYLGQYDGLIRFLRARGAGDEAEDLVQELGFNLSARETTPISDPIAYVFRAANTLMINRCQSNELSDRGEDHSCASCEEVAGETAAAASQAIAHAEQRLRSLGQRVLRAFILFRIDGLQQKEIARQLGVSPSIVEKDLENAYRAIMDLRSQVDADQ